MTRLTVVSKILGRIVIDRIRTRIGRRFRKEQAGFRSGRGTTEQIFILRNILEQVNEWQATLYINFVDFEKAFDSMHRNGLWMIKDQYGIPQVAFNASFQDDHIFELFSRTFPRGSLRWPIGAKHNSISLLKHNNLFENTIKFSDTQTQTETQQNFKVLVTNPDAVSDRNLGLAVVTWVC